MLRLKNVTLFMADGRTDRKSFDSSLFAVRQCIDKVDFGEVIFQSAYDSDISGVGYKKIKPMVIGEYSKLISGNLTDHINTQFVLVVQHDGFILNTANWNPDFLNYDYIGAPWLIEATQRPNCRVGNGGFSLRSKKLLDVCKKHYGGTWDNEDWQICLVKRPFFESHGIVFAPLDVATWFSIESHIPEYDHDIKKRFGFHGPRQYEAVNAAYGFDLK